MLTMSNVAPKVLSNDNVPCWAVLLVKLALAMRRNVLLNLEFLHRLLGNLYGFELHLVGHVDVLDGGLG